MNVPDVSTITYKRATFTVLPWIILLIGVPLSFFLFVLVSNSVEYVARLRFEREAQTANDLIEDRLRSYSDVLFALRALFASRSPVDRLHFHRFIQALDLKHRYPGFDSLNYAQHVFSEDKQAFEQAVRIDRSLDPHGYPDFAIKPAGQRPEYYVILYLEPMKGYEFAFGLDIATNPAAENPDKLLAALRSARDSGKLTASGQPLRIKRETVAVYLAMRLAVYRPGMALETLEQRRSAYAGSVGAGLNVENLMKGALSDEVLRNLQVRLYDAGSSAEHEVLKSQESTRLLLFDSDQLDKQSSKGSVTSVAHFVHVLPVEIATRRWEFEYSAEKRRVMSDADRFLPPAVLAGGLTTSLLLFGVLYFMASSRRRAIEMAAEITKDLRESEAGLAEAQQMAHLGNWSLDPASWRMTASEETWRVLGLRDAQDDFSYADFLQRIHLDDRAAVDATLRKSIEGGNDCEIEHRIQSDPRTVRWVHTVLHPGRRDARGRLPGTIMNITQRKLAEEELRVSAAQLQALSRRLVDAQESERRRFSRELHDLVGQNLTALSINLDILKSQLGHDGNDALRSRLGDSEALLESTTAAIENVMSELRPPMLDDYGLLSALQWYANDFSRRTRIEVKIRGDEHMVRLPPESEIALFRIAQEALNNVAKHARAECVDITLESRNAHIIMSITDDGIGFDSGGGAKPRRRPGLGMVTMRERTQAIGGSFDMQAQAGRGTQIIVTVPA